MSLLDTLQKGIKKIIATDSDVMTLHNETVTYSFVNSNAGSVGEMAGAAAMSLNESNYIFAVGIVDWREGDKFERRGKWYQINAVSIDGSISGGIISTTAQVTEVSNL